MEALSVEVGTAVGMPAAGMAATGATPASADDEPTDERRWSRCSRSIAAVSRDCSIAKCISSSPSLAPSTVTAAAAVVEAAAAAAVAAVEEAEEAAGLAAAEFS